MEDKENSLDSLEFNKITEYLNKKSEKDEKFKEQLKKITNIFRKNYIELSDFFLEIRSKNLRIDLRQYHYTELLKIGFEFLKIEKPITKYLLSLFDPDELNIKKIIEQYKKKITFFHTLKSEKKQKELDEMKAKLIKKLINEKIEKIKNRLKEIKKHDNYKNKEDKISEENDYKINKNQISNDLNKDSLSEINSIVNEFDLGEINNMVQELKESISGVDNKEVLTLMDEINKLILDL